MGTMNVLVAIDPDTIQQKFGSTKNSSDSPVGVGSAHVTVMTSANGQTSIGVTDLSVEEEDEILWWVASPGGCSTTRGSRKFYGNRREVAQFDERASEPALRSCRADAWGLWRSSDRLWPGTW
jgi:hypothetical protein